MVGERLSFTDEWPKAQGLQLEQEVARTKGSIPLQDSIYLSVLIRLDWALAAALSTCQSRREAVKRLREGRALTVRRIRDSSLAGGTKP